MRIVGVDIGGTSIMFGVFNEQGIKEQSWIFHIKQGSSGKTILDQLIKRIETIGDIDAIGICVPGQVDAKTGSVIGSLVNIPQSTNLQIKAILQARLSIPVFICNDVQAAALGERRFGTAVDTANHLFIAFGTGIGGAIVRDGEIDIGENGYAGEFGHIITHANGRRCSCGVNGCYEMYGSTKALVQSAMQIDTMYDNGHNIIAAYKRGHKKIQTTVDTWLNEVVAGLVSLVHIFNPTTLILGGGIMENDFLITDIQTRINGQILQAFRNVIVKRATLGNESGMYGAVVFSLKGA